MIKIALNQTRLINPTFLDEANRVTVFEGVLSWSFGPPNIASIEPVPGMPCANITGTAVGKGQLKLTDGLGKVYACVDVTVYDAGPGPWDTDAVRAELVLE